MMRTINESTIESLAGPDGLTTDGDWIESKDQDQLGDVRLIQLADIGVGKFLDRSSRFLTRETALRLNCTFLEPGDVLIARMPDPIGRACIFPDIGRAAVAAVDVFVWRRGQHGADARWLMHALNSPQVAEELEMLASGTTRQRVSGRQIKALSIEAPELQVQRERSCKIDTIHEACDEAISDLTRAVSLARRYGEAVLSAECSGFIQVDVGPGSGEQFDLPAYVPGPQFDDLPDLPDGWKWAEMKSLASVTGGLTKNANRAALALTMPYVTVANVYYDELRLRNIGSIGVTESERSRVLLQNGDLLVVEGNGSIGQIGRVAEWDGSIAECGHQNHLIRVRPNPGVPGRYLLHWLMSPFGRSALESVASSSSGLHTLSISKVKAIPVAMPPPRIAAELARIADETRTKGESLGRDAERALQLVKRIKLAANRLAFDAAS